MDFKLLNCPIHPEEQVICLSKNPSDKKLLFCVHCILQAEPSTKENLVAFKNGLEETYAKLYSADRLVIDDSSLDPLLEAFDTKNEAVQNLTDHIRKERERVENELDSLTSEIVQLIHSTKMEILCKLDKEIETLKNNYAIFRQKLKKYSEFDNGSRKISTLEEFYNELFKENSPDIFEQRWRDLIEDAKETNFYSVYGNKAKRVLTDKLEEYKLMIEAGQKVFPRSFVASGLYYNTAKKELTDIVKNFAAQISKIDSNVLMHEEFLKCINLTGSWNSQVLQIYDFPILEKISGAPIYNMSLEYRASRDGIDQIKKLFNQLQNILLLIKTVDGQIIGYRKIIIHKKDFNGQKSNKVVEKNYIFSLTTQNSRFEEKSLNPYLSQIGWPSKSLRLNNPFVLRTECGYMEICPTLDGNKFHCESFSPKEVEAFIIF